MDRQEKIAYLRRYRDNEREIDRLMDEIARTRSLAEKVTASFALAPSHGDDGGDRVQTGVERIEALCEQLEARLFRKVELLEEIERVINAVQDARFREVLRLRYMDGWTLEHVADVMEMDYRWIRRLHAKSIEQIVLD